MEHVLIVIDMQNDFVDGVLGSPEAVSILPAVVDKISHHQGRIIFTRDTHGKDYMETREGKYLPVPHCINGTRGWEIKDRVWDAANGKPHVEVIDKPTFGSTELSELLVKYHGNTAIEKITLIGVCTDICVISNAMLIKAALPEIDVIVDADCCAGVTSESHNNALTAMKACQIIIENF
ncbi:MAG: cysteine hydrolase [Ruminococcaceae bacterium]|nr:cysteine hydrolase [Oscillospiraceae bacterium]